MMKPVAASAPRTVAWIAGGLIVVQGLVLARTFSTISKPDKPLAPSHVAGAHTTDTALIARGHLFGEPPHAPEADEARAVASSGAYSLKGIVAFGTAGEGFAIIVGTNGRSNLYETGHSIAKEVVVQRVNPDYVLLQNRGRLERLTLPHGALAMQLIAGTTRTESATAEATGTLTSDTRSSLETFGLNVVGDSAGGITGISGKGSPSWQHSGLEPTDVIVSIDGTPVGDVLKTPGALDNASMAAATTLTVLRAGVQMDITAVPEEAQVSRMSRHRS
jgi:type II secretory pathway component PulC